MPGFYSAAVRGREQAGFTLIELAAVLVISGLLMLVAVGLIRNYYSELGYRKTVENVRTIDLALNEYLGLKGRYPCPADPSLSSSDPDYGKEKCRPVPLPVDCAPVVPPLPAAIRCTTVESRDADGDGLQDVVMIGMLPVREIVQVIKDVPLRENQGLDGYGNRFTYAVTESMTNTANNAGSPVKYDLGAIRVEDENGVSLTFPDRSSHFVVVSHGGNGKGAYAQGGSQITGCHVLVGGVPQDLPPGALGVGVDPEKENCDRNDAIFIDGVKSINENNNSYNDDIVSFKVGGFYPLWVHSLNTPPGKIWITNTNMGNVAVGPGLADAGQLLQVNGDISAETEVRAQAYCGSTGPDGAGNSANDDCMYAETIGGTGTNCANPTHAAINLENNRLGCKQLIPAPTTPGVGVAGKSCPTGTYLVGISNLGNVRCKSI